MNYFFYISLSFCTSVLALDHRNGCTYVFKEPAGSSNSLANKGQLTELIDCSWKIILRKRRRNRWLLADISKNTIKTDKICQCNCANITIKIGKHGRHRTLCEHEYVPFILNTKASYVTIHYRGPRGLESNLLSIVTSIYDNTKIGNRVLRSADDVEVDSQSANQPSEKGKEDGKDEKKKGQEQAPKIWILTSAIPTILIFIVCVIAIAYKNYCQERHSYTGSIGDLMAEEEENLLGCCPKLPSSKKGKIDTKQELYDVMLRRAMHGDTTKKPIRKSSSIMLEGYTRPDPRTLARKHLALNKMRKSDKGGEGMGGAIGKLISSAAMAGGIHGVAPPAQQAKSNTLEEKVTVEDATIVEEIPLWQIEHQLESEPMFQVEEEPTDSPNSQTNLLQADQNHESESQRFNFDDIPACDTTSPSTADNQLTYDCAEHISRILAASREDINVAMNIITDDAREVLLPTDLEDALAQFEYWPDSSV